MIEIIINGEENVREFMKDSIKGIPITVSLNGTKLTRFFDENNRMEEINEIIRKTESDIRENENTQKILNIIETRKRHGRRHGRRQRKK